MKVEQYTFPDDLFYMLGEPGHIWIRKQDDNVIVIGIDDYASKRAGEIEFVRTMKEDQRVTKGQIIGTFESGKWVGQIKAPFNGRIIAKNSKLRRDPDLINSDPYGEGWILSLEVKEIKQQIEEDELIVPAGVKLYDYIQKRISQE